MASLRLAHLLLPLAPALLLAACDNVGGAFDSGRGRGGGGGQQPDPASTIQLPPAGGITRSARPRVLFAGPTGSGWPATTPVVVLFDESMNLASIRQSSGMTPTHLHVRAEGTTDALPGNYTLLLGGRLLVFRSTAPLPPRRDFEVVIGNTVRDVDKQRVARQGVVATFTTDAPADGGFRLITTVPVTNDRTVQRESPVFLILAAPANPQTVTGDSVFLQKSDRTKVRSDVSFPIQVGTAPDPRVIQLTPQSPLDASTRYEVKVTPALKAGNLELDAGGRDPVARFTSIGPLAAEAARVGNPTAGFENRVNLANLQNLQVAVDVPAATRSGDRVTVRVYGNDARKTQDELAFVEKTATVAMGGKSTTSVSFAGSLGSVGATKFKDGGLTLVARVSRGSNLTGYVRVTGASQDTVAPALRSIGPPKGAGTNVYLTDLNAVALNGIASERIGGLSLTVGSQTLGLFGSDASGRFMSMPFLLNRTTAATSFTLALRDAAGNPSGAAVTGSIVQRGLLTGNVSAGKLTVVAYDDATLLPVQGAAVLIEPGMPKKPASGRLTKTTDAKGVATFTGLTQSTYTVTLVKAGYDLTSILDTATGYASLPLRPLVNPTAKLTGSAVFQPGRGAVARVGVNLLDDPSLDSFVQTSASSPTAISNVDVRPNRPLMVTGFAGVMPPAQKPTFASGATLYGAISGGRGANQAPLEAKGGGATYTFQMALLPSLNAFVNFASSYALDLSPAAGLDTANLARNPTVSVLMSLSGFGGMVYVGPGFAAGGGKSWTIDGSYSLTALLDYGGLGPVFWSSTQAEDKAGNKTRNRALFGDPLAGSILPLVPAAGIPTVTAPAGPFTGSPLVKVADRLSATVFAGSVALRRIRAKDAAGRGWTLLYQDRDAATGTDAVQFPDLAGTGLTGLATGTWSVSAEDILMVGPGLGSAELNFEDVPRLELTYARARPVDHSVR